MQIDRMTDAIRTRVRGSVRAARPALATLALGVVLAACGGGGGSDPPKPGALTVTLNDSYGSPVPGATVQATDGVLSRSATTNASGVAVLAASWPDGTADVTVSGPALVTQTVSTPIASGELTDVSVTVERATSAAGGSLASRSGFVPLLSRQGRALTFEVELVIVDAASEPVQNLGAADFTLVPCTPDTGNDRPDCIGGGSTTADGAYVPDSAAPEAFEGVAGAPARPYAAALLLDQSGSIAKSDPTGARLFSAKAFLQSLGGDDRARLAAFASGADARVPEPPLTVYGPFQDQASATSYFPTLDGLAPLVGGDTPLYQSLDELVRQVVADTGLPGGISKAVVVFTDGDDTDCLSQTACATARAQSIQTAKQGQVRVFTIGLSSSVNAEALGELAAATGGAMLYAESAEQLLPLYGTVGRLLSLSLPTYRLRWTVEAAAPGLLQPGSRLLGRVQVNLGSQVIDVPLVVGIP
jgi:hypothetical protein